MKPENILLDSKNKKVLDVKISDFGFSCFFDPQQGLDLVLGSPLYMAPEIIKKQKYNEKVDIWSSGIIMYMLLTGRNPFPGKSKEEVKQMIVTKELDFNKSYFMKISAECKDFLTKALTKKVEERWSAEQLLKHPWLVNQIQEQQLDPAEQGENLKNLIQFSKADKF